MQINRGVTSVPLSLSFNELEYGAPYRIEGKPDELVICSFLRCGYGRSESKIPKVVSLITGEIYSVEQARNWRFFMVSASVSV